MKEKQSTTPKADRSDAFLGSGTSVAGDEEGVEAGAAGPVHFAEADGHAGVALAAALHDADDFADAVDGVVGAGELEGEVHLHAQREGSGGLEEDAVGGEIGGAVAEGEVVADVFGG